MDYLEQNFELAAVGKDIDKFVDSTKTVSKYMHYWSQVLESTVNHMVAYILPRTYSKSH